jgi:hypothetical protein
MNMKRWIGLSTAVMIVTLMGLIGCAESTPTVQYAPEIGSKCTVHFRNDALGTRGQGRNDPNLAIQDKAGWTDGNFSRMNDNWLILTQEDRERWIPRNTILLVEVRDK